MASWALASFTLIAGTSAMPAVAAPPPSVGPLVTMSRPPDASETQRLNTYAAYHAERLVGDDPEVVGPAHNALAQPLRAPGLSRFFRSAYSQALVPLLGPKIDSAGTAQGRINAVQIIAQLGTEDALEVLERHCSLRNEDDLGVRIWASRGMLIAIEEGRGDGSIIDRSIRSAVRELQQAIDAETDWRVMQWQFDALTSIDAQTASEALGAAFASVLRRLAQRPQATPLIRALGQFSAVGRRPRGPLSTLTQRFVDLPPGDMRRVGPTLVDQLVQVLRIAELHWESAQADPSLKDAYQRAVRLSENQARVLLTTIGRRVPDGLALERAYAAGDRDTYSQQLAQLEAAAGSGG